MGTYRFHGSLTRAFRATRRNIPRHSRAAILHAFGGYWATLQHGTKRKGIPVANLPPVTNRFGGATRRSAKPWLRTPSFRFIPRGRSYGARDLGEVRRVTGGYKVGDRFGISVQHPGAILARNLPFRSGPRAGQLPTKKVPAGVGFHGEALRESEDRFRRFREFKEVAP